MKLSKLILLPTFLLAVPLSLSAQVIVNIDFLAKRGTETASTNYVGSGPDGGGTTYNGLAANDSSSSDDINVSSSGLHDSNGLLTTEHFSITDVGADSEPGQSNLGVTNSGYVFVNSANNTATSAAFTISGLGTATSATLYFTSTNDYSIRGQPLTFNGDTASPANFTPTGIFTTNNTTEFVDVPVVDGEITGTYGSSVGSGTALFGALTIVADGVSVSAPEPSTWALAIVGGAVLLVLVRRRNSIRS